jgi:hypothetical protein
MSPRVIIVVVLAAVIPGCTTLADISAGQVGCPPAAITVTDENRTLGGSTWTAECNGQQYYCSAHGGGEGATAQVACSPAGGGTNVPGGGGAVAAPAASGCQYDTQCKGERVCSAGACVDPAPPAAAPPAEPTPPAATTPAPEAPAAPPA